MYASRHLSDNNRKKLIKQILKPSLLYAAPAWAGALTSRKVRLRRGFSMAAKQILRLPRRHSTVQLYDALKVSIIETIIDDSRAEMAVRSLSTNAPNLVALAEDIRNTWLTWPFHNHHFTIKSKSSQNPRVVNGRSTKSGPINCPNITLWFYCVVTAIILSLDPGRITMVYHK